MALRNRKLDCSELSEQHLMLIIEDQLTLASEISDQLTTEGFAPRVLLNKRESLDAALVEDAAIVILARPVFGDDSLDIIETMREKGVDTPVLIISALGAIDERIRGLRAGADDYLVKPFAMGELAARIHAIVRRAHLRRAMRMRVGPLEIDTDNQRVWRDGRRIELFPREFEILEYFARRPGEVVTREDLLKDVWQYPSTRLTNTVDVHLSSLRRKLDAGADRPIVVNIRRAGFVLRAD